MTPSEFQTQRSATPAQMADLETLIERLTAANAVMNLVGPDTIPDVWNRHIFDSAQLLDLAPKAGTWADLGAGAGFPGLVLAILLKDRADSHVWLIDSLGKRCRFLQEAVDALSLRATVVNGRAEEQRIKVDVVTARALAPMDRLLGYAQPYLQRGAQGLFLKGEKAEAELIEARKVWQFDSDLSVSRSDPRGRIVSVRSLRRVQSR
ncbi:MAG: 16S rRNA (guanine(527)-N(7))-methyltransferase RsmG [Alphaproteobacteria bacterium]|jgi:16S rRNA (guanine527-N7)-methyltransferase|nr:16S rRNA (guanine(527)-N(7))-methyltransferase RsmG [Alphaproteobacteria bacterium]MBU2042305.1 16S rRNA (guanine(527)-N(7))-methyltransferase RsmG [Alphaproteobacteria bacterium]MBU2126362.1 16S rRNA (guanine(527)-N(7))-methyltransferase RsmG [Alphaproteobacteria bacterium]MBU2209811.1 16S rRNA (guanine(527)-N(7))-methyltransferase RsmG [Alphaproteobacteria bacterium]MBU2290716.1 16S rRNA (guanine(527)-N(7))-methyltransferase RsmG [Alphaproteobacteria bacterium]